MLFLCISYFVLAKCLTCCVMIHVMCAVDIILICFLLGRINSGEVMMPGCISWGHITFRFITCWWELVRCMALGGSELGLDCMVDWLILTFEIQCCSLRDNINAFDRYKLRPRVLRDVTYIDPSTTFLGKKVRLDLMLGFCSSHGLLQ